MSSSIETEAVKAGVRIVRPRWSGAVLLCNKCVKRHAEGKALRRALKADLKARAAGGPGKRRVRIIKMACLGLCPRGAVVVASAATLTAGEVMLVKDPADVSEALPLLLPKAPTS